MQIKDFNFMEDYYYDSEHNWAHDEGDVVTIGVSDFFQKTANEIVFIEVPLVGRTIEKGQPYSSIESGKWVGRLKGPISGEIVAANTELTDCPYLLNENPYDDGWIIKVKPKDRAELSQLFNLGEPEQAKKFAEFIDAEDLKIKESKK